MKYDKYLDVISSKASEFNVKPDIHEKDYIFEFLMENKSFTCQEDAINYYFMDGEKSAKKLLRYISDVCEFDNKIIKLLEFASGYGCVTRHFKNVLQDINVTSCDIHEEAITFIKSNFFRLSFFFRLNILAMDKASSTPSISLIW